MAIIVWRIETWAACLVHAPIVVIDAISFCLIFQSKFVMMHLLSVCEVTRFVYDRLVCSLQSFGLYQYLATGF